MYQTSFKGITTLYRNVHYAGGFCKVWYIPLEAIDIFPRVNPSTQTLVSEPSLKAGTTWHGPLYVPNDQLGFKETIDRVRIGHYWKNTVQAVSLGDSVDSRVNLENMLYHKYLVMGKVRAGGFYMLFGSKESPMTLQALDHDGGQGAGATAKSSFNFYNEQSFRALIVPSFTADTTPPATGGSGGGTGMSNLKEIIPYDNEPVVHIPWTSERLEKFGYLPIVEVYIKDGDTTMLNIGAQIEVDAPPPAFTEMTIHNPAGVAGFIVIT